MIQIPSLLNSASKLMNVDGSISNKTFSYSPGGVLSAQVMSLSVILCDTGTMDFNKFSGQTALTNGLVLQQTIGGITTAIATVKDNADLASVFDINQYGNAAVLSILSIVTPQGFGNSNKVFAGKFNIPNLILTGSDSISAVVKDNLSGVNYLQMRCLLNLDG